MWSWLMTWATAEPLEAIFAGLYVICSVLIVLFGVGLYRAIRTDMREHEDDDGRWPQEGNVRR